jgi:hypothetical protein
MLEKILMPRSSRAVADRWCSSDPHDVVTAELDLHFAQVGPSLGHIGTQYGDALSAASMVTIGAASKMI